MTTSKSFRAVLPNLGEEELQRLRRWAEDNCSASSVFHGRLPAPWALVDPGRSLRHRAHQPGARRSARRAGYADATPRPSVRAGSRWCQDHILGKAERADAPVLARAQGLDRSRNRSTHENDTRTRIHFFCSRRTSSQLLRSKLAPRSEQALADEADDDVPDEVPEPQEADVQPRDTEDAPGDADGRGEEQVHWPAGERPRAHGRGK